VSKRKPKKPTVAFTFDKGEQAKMPATEVERRLQSQHHRMAASDDPLMRAVGRRLAEQHVAAAVKGRMVSVHAKTAAKADRPNAKSLLRQRIINAMGPDKAAGVTFKVLMKRWERDPLDGLRLTLTGDRYTITDENGSDDSFKTYTLGTLEKLYSKA
jgi:hypothetical protein